MAGRQPREDDSRGEAAERRTGGRRGFNHDLLESKVAEQVRTSADRIRERVKKTVEDIIDVGKDLLAVKEAARFWILVIDYRH
jgi:hypothetical protein